MSELRSAATASFVTETIAIFVELKQMWHHARFVELRSAATASCWGFLICKIVHALLIEVNQNIFCMRADSHLIFVSS